MIRKYASQIFTFLLIAFMLSLSLFVIIENNQITPWLVGITGLLYGGFAFYILYIGLETDIKEIREKLNKLKDE